MNQMITFIFVRKWWESKLCLRDKVTIDFVCLFPSSENKVFSYFKSNLEVGHSFGRKLFSITPGFFMACIYLPVSLNSWSTPDAFPLAVPFRDISPVPRCFLQGMCHTRREEMPDSWHLLAGYSSREQLTCAWGRQALKVHCFDHLQWLLEFGVTRGAVLSLRIRTLFPHFWM